MPNVTIPKELVDKKDLIAVPRGTYEEFLGWLKKVKSGRTFKPTQAEKKSLEQARKNFAKGKYTPWEDIKYDLGRNRR